MPEIENYKFEGFSKLNQQERFQKLLSCGALTAEDFAFLKTGGIKNTVLAEKLIENVIGYFQLPLGVATHFRIDNEDYVIPMAVEETSIIAAVSKTAKWIKQKGYIETKVEGSCIIGQIQLAKVRDFDRFSVFFAEHKASWIDIANKEVAFNMVRRGGGVFDLELRSILRDDGLHMVVIHVLMDSCDAMGANILNQVLEHLKPHIEKVTFEEVTMCILSNLNDKKITSATVYLENIDADLGEKIAEASYFAKVDPYRAATNNKGVMNGIDPILIATGNDWRAVEAGIHAYATRNGNYTTITSWKYENKVLIGNFKAPLIVGIVGGVTTLHPTAKLCLNMMRISSANHLSRIIAAVGLVQNLGAIKALCTDGIIQGHMKLHIDNLALVAGATDKELPLLKERLQSWLFLHKKVSLNKAYEFLTEIRHVVSS